MKDQHTKIKGYRDLSQQEIDLMNRIKEHAKLTEDLLDAVYDMRTLKNTDGIPENSLVSDSNDLSNLQKTESIRCLSIAKEKLQTGQMWFVRAVALPDSF